MLVIAIATGGYWYSHNHLTEDQVTQNLHSTLQHQLDAGDLQSAHLQVGKITLLHDEGNRYQAMATVTSEGISRDIPLKVLVDGTKVAWQADPGAFAFVAQEQIKQSLAVFRAQTEKAAAEMASQVAATTMSEPTPSNADASPVTIPANVKILTDQWERLNGNCRGGSGDDPATQKACDARENIYTKIAAQGWCWGHKDDIGADRKWVPCAAGDT
jgi:hypothetical protein